MASLTQQRAIGRYAIGRTLGSGMSAKVRLGMNMETGQQVALKLINKQKLSNRQIEMLDREITAMRALDHENTIGLLDVEMDLTYTKKNLSTYQVVLLVLELAGGGELFDFVMHTGPFSEVEARTYFTQLVSALECCHTQGIYHRDLKPENLMLDSNYQLKVADFGLSAICMTDGSGYEELLETECGTRSYMCPEMIAHQRYLGSKADIWSAGVVLFIMVTGHPPFQMAVDKDWWFCAVKANRHDRFWAAHLRTNPDLPESFQQFMNTIFVADPDQRATLQDLKVQEWMQGPTLSAAELRQQIQDRKAQVDASKEAERLQARAVKAAELARLSGRAQRVQDPFNANTYRKLGNLRPPELPSDIWVYDVFFSPQIAEDILDSMNTACKEMGAMDLVKKTEACGMRASFEPSPDSGSHPIQIKFQIYTVKDGDEDMCVLHFQRRTGDLFEYQKVQKAFLEKMNSVLSSGQEAIEEVHEAEEEKADEEITNEVDLI